MTRSEITVLFLKLVAIYLWFQALIYGSFLASFYWFGDANGASASPASLSLVVPMILFGVLGTLVFFLSPILVPRSTEGSVAIEFAEPDEIGAIGLRIAAVFLWLRGIQLTSAMMSILPATNAGGDWGHFLQEAAMFAVLTGTGAWLFLRARALARSWFGARSYGIEAQRSSTLQAVAFSVVGLWILVDALPNLVALGFALVEWMRTEELVTPSFGESGSGWFAALGVVLRAALGVGLFLGGRGLSLMWHRIQNAGLSAQRAGLDPKHEHV